jgi:hypothetical protein
MPEYDFHQLSPADLEVLARDLLQAHWKVTLESFKSGRDGGIDLRYAKGPNRTIVQVKHYVRTGIVGLLRELKKEAQKLAGLKPSRYALVTSVPLSPADKAKIVSIFGSSRLKGADVFGADDLNNLLTQYPHIEKNHYKLWLASKAVLDRVLHNAAATRSEFKARQVYRQARRYVATSAFPRAMEMLDQERVVVISGPPGVGKTTLADLLLYAHLERGYQAVLVERDPAEAFEVFDPNTRQVFYYDDFMGATFAGDQRGATLGNEDHTLLTFINMVRETPNARLVLTTREHVYSQAMTRSERLRNADLGSLRVTIRMPSYDFFQRAAILYNHIYFSDLPIEYQDEIVADGFYLKIVKHEKFNPRLIDWLSSYKRLKVPVDQYRQFVAALLDDPSDIWRHAYHNEISEAARGVLLALWSLSGRCGSDVLRHGFSALQEGRSARYLFGTRAEDYSMGLRELEDSFVRPTISGGVEVIDPSVLDLMNAVVREAPANAMDIVAFGRSFTQVEHVWKFAQIEGNDTVMDELAQHPSRFASHVGTLAAMPRRVEWGDNSFGYLAPPYEVRIRILLEMANSLGCKEIALHFDQTFARLKAEWRSLDANVQNALTLLHSLTEEQPWLPASAVAEARRTTEAAIGRSISRGVPAFELQEIMDSMDIFVDRDVVLAGGKEGFDEYATARLFHEDLAEARSSAQCADLIETLRSIGSAFGVNTTVLISKVELEMHDLEEAEEQRADYEYDAWKDRRSEEARGERYLSEMFASLRSDRQ